MCQPAKQNILTKTYNSMVINKYNKKRTIKQNILPRTIEDYATLTLTTPYVNYNVLGWLTQIVKPSGRI